MKEPRIRRLPNIGEILKWANEGDKTVPNVAKFRLKRLADGRVISVAPSAPPLPPEQQQPQQEGATPAAQRLSARDHGTTLTYRPHQGQREIERRKRRLV